MTFGRRFYAGIGLVASGVGTYLFYRMYWIKIHVFPKETRAHLRDALYAERSGLSGDAERSFHHALATSIQLAGENSVANLLFVLSS